jgi:hypothetical protein
MGVGPKRPTFFAKPISKRALKRKISKLSHSSENVLRRAQASFLLATLL